MPPQMNGVTVKLIEYDGLYELVLDSAVANEGTVSLKTSGKVGGWQFGIEWFGIGSTRSPNNWRERVAL